MKQIRDRKESTDPIAIKVNIAHSFITHRGWEMVKGAIACGHLLTEHKQQLGHGRFLRWCKSELVFSWQTANVYMKLYEFRDRLNELEPESLRTALKLTHGDKRTQGLLSGDEKILRRNILGPIKTVKRRLRRLPTDPIHYETVVDIVNELRNVLEELMEELK
jgi:hypothetical protein